MTTTAHTLADPDTPFAVVDVAKARRNTQRLQARLETLGVGLRPHVKTAKALEAAALMQQRSPGPITVSTLAEAEAFADAGYTDITYAVGIDPHKLARVTALLRRGVTVKVLLDSNDQATTVAAASRQTGIPIPALIEIDCDGHRGGVSAESADLIEIGRTLHSAGSLDGVLVHAGESYYATTASAQQEAAANERDVAVTAAERLRGEGLAVATVSAGSTPTAHAAEDLTGITEVRAGNYIFFDLVMAGIGVCQLEDIAMSVVVTVIGHRPELGWIITDGGWMALSRDRGTAQQAQDQGYGLVTGVTGTLLPGLVVSDTSQEHGIITARDGHTLPDLPIGTRLRILPNHACATASQHSRYHTIDSSEPDLAAPAPTVRAIWNRIDGW